MNQQISEWEKESNVFYEWFKSLGGNIADDEQMAEAFSRIEAKSVSDSKLYQLLDNRETVIINGNPLREIINGRFSGESERF